jgi:hypothetical protein
MYIPPYAALLQVLKKSRSDLDDQASIEIPVLVFKLLLKAAILGAEFDEESYLQANPDVRRAVRDGEIKSGYQHFVQFGYFEGRKGGMNEVDPRWYLRTYPDIAAAVKNGKIDYAREHFYDAGAAEGRSPNPDYVDDAEQWKYAFGAARRVSVHG